jgi:hypothetical protein
MAVGMTGDDINTLALSYGHVVERVDVFHQDDAPVLVCGHVYLVKRRGVS